MSLFWAIFVEFRYTTWLTWDAAAMLAQNRNWSESLKAQPSFQLNPLISQTCDGRTSPSFQITFSVPVEGSATTNASRLKLPAMLGSSTTVWNPKWFELLMRGRIKSAYFDPLAS